MNNSNFNGFPIDGSYGSQIKYDLFAKYMSNAITSVNSTNASNLGVLGLLFAIFQIILVIVLTVLLLFGKLINFVINLFISNKLKQNKKNENKRNKEYIDDLCSGLESE